MYSTGSFPVDGTINNRSNIINRMNNDNYNINITFCIRARRVFKKGSNETIGAFTRIAKLIIIL